MPEQKEGEKQEVSEKKPQITSVSAAVIREKREEKELVQKKAASAIFPKKPAQEKRQRQDEPGEDEPLDNWNISLMLDNYDDIFSDFDARHFSERAISHDFLEECKRAARDKVNSGLEIRMMIPAKERDLISEGIIKQRLKKHFQKHLRERIAELSKVRKEGAVFTSIGMIFLFVAGFVYTWETNLLTSMLLVLLEPGGWFLAWTGLDTLRASRQRVPDLEFYSKMTNAEFIFFSY